jgi:hypothetical protein
VFPLPQPGASSNAFEPSEGSRRAHRRARRRLCRYGRRREDWPPRLRRHEAPKYFEQVHNVSISAGRLAVLAVEGAGPRFSHWGRYPIYELDDLDQWVADRLAGRTRAAIV